MSADRAITILHLSDTQFGRNYRFGRLCLPPPDDKFDSLLSRLGNDLNLMKKDCWLCPDLMILTGDLAEWGMPDEFKNVLEFIEGVAELLNLNRDRVIIVPGNHDVNRKACESYFLRCEANQEKPVPPFGEKWQHYYDCLFKKFYKERHSISFSDEQPWTLFEIPDLKVVVAGLNSTMAESHKDDDHYGYIGESQLKWFADKLEVFKAKGWLRIGALHHNIRRGPVADDENLRDADDLNRILGNVFNLILHGHTHDGKTDFLNPKVPILATGSAALTPEARPEETPNQYQIVQVSADGFCRWGRIYDPGGKRWIGDVRASEKGDNWMQDVKVDFENISAIIPKGPGSLKKDQINPKQDGEREESESRDDQEPIFKLPWRPPAIVGRDAELNEIGKLLQDLGCVYIYGPPGVGKTTLAKEVVWRLQDHFRGAVIYDFALERKFDDILNLMARSFSANTLVGLGLAEKQIEVERLLLRHQPVLVYLDNLETTGVLNQLEGLSGSCALLITSRERSSFGWLEVKELEMLDHPSSIQLFEESYGQSLSEQDHVHVNEICAILGGMPLAIHLCASRAKVSRLPISSLLSRDPLSLTKFRDRSVEVAIEFSYDRLNDPNKQFFVMLSLFGGLTFSLDALGAMWAQDDAFDQLNQLTDLSLVEVAEDGRFVLHPLIQEFAVKRLKNSNDKSVFLDRMITYFRKFAEENRKVFVKLGIERENILAAMKECDRKSDAEKYLGFADAMLKMYPGSHYAYGYLPQKGFWDEAMHIVLRSLKLTGELVSKAKLYEHRGLIHYWKGEHDKSTESYEKAIALFKEHNDYYGEALIMHRLGFIQSDEGFYRDCEDLYRRSVEIAQQHHLSDEILATGIHLVGVILYHQCRYEESQENLEKALEMRKKINSVAASVTMRRLAATYRRMGRLQEAEKMLHECLIVERESGNERNIARCLRQIGMVNLALEYFDDARDNFEQSCEIFQKIGNKKGIASVQTNLGELNLKQGRLEEAERQLRESLDMAKKLKSQYGMAMNQWWIAEIQYRRSEYRKAAKQALEALRHFESIEHVHVEEVCQLLNRALFKLNLKETCRIALPNFCDGQCSKEIDEKYKELWNDARIRLTENNPHVDEHLLHLPHDKRRGISLIIRLSEETKQLLARVSDRLRKVAPDHHYYAPSDYHITVMTIIVANELFNLNDVPVEQYNKYLSKILSRQRPFRFRFRGIGGSKDCVIAHGTFRDGTLDLIRRELKEELFAHGIEGQFDDRYHNISAHVTFVRFRSKNNLKKLVQEIDQLESCDLGVCPVDKLELVTNDWYMSRDKVEVLKSFELR